MRRYGVTQYVSHRDIAAAGGQAELIALAEDVRRAERRALFDQIAEDWPSEERTVIDWVRTVRRDEDNRRTEITGEARVYLDKAPPNAAATAPDTFPLAMAIDAIRDGIPEYAEAFILDYLAKHQAWAERCREEGERQQREAMGLPESLYDFPVQVDDELRFRS